MRENTVLVVDDDRTTREQLGKELTRNFFRSLSASDGATALAILSRENIDIIIVDVKLPDMNGLDIVVQGRALRPDCEVIVITGYGTQEIAIQALRRGAIDYIEKPINMESLCTALGRAQEKLAEKKELHYENTLLVIDDDEDVVKRLKHFLKSEGFEVFGVCSGNEGLDIVEKKKIDLIVTDMKLGDIEGIEVIRRAKGFYQDIEGIVITGHREQDFAVRALRAGAIDYVAKPLDLDELLFAIKRAIERISLNRNRLYRNREQKIASEIVAKMNEELERRIEQRSKELSQTQTQLFQTSKLATLGEMSAGLAHEINQPLGGIALVAKNMRKLQERDRLSKDEVTSALNDIESSVKRMSRIIQHIRTFARQDTLKFIEVDVNDTIDSAMNLLGEQLRLHDIEVELALDTTLPKINGEPYQLEQVWINMLSNARDALDEAVTRQNTDGGKYQKKIRISTDSCVSDGQKSVRVSFRDNGIGMTETQKEKVFEPFFTTKEVGKATGLGMAISHGIVETHKGKIEVETKHLEGTTFTVILPVGA